LRIVASESSRLLDPDGLKVVELGEVKRLMESSRIFCSHGFALIFRV